MIVVLRADADQGDALRLCDWLTSAGFEVATALDAGREVLLASALGEPQPDTVSRLRADPAVERVVPLERPYRLVARMEREIRTVQVGDVVFGGEEIVVMAGPCSVESEDQIAAAARYVARSGAKVLRGGAFKPSTSPYGFQGLGVAGLALLRDAARESSLLTVSEVMDPREVDIVARHIDILQIGARSMQNFDLLKEAGASGMPVLLKRGMSARYEEWLLAAEYVALAGSERIVLCERGIRTFEPTTRNTLDVTAVPAVKALSWLPVAVDPSHAAGRSDWVPALALAAVAAGADALLVEVHPRPAESVKDGVQALDPEAFDHLMANLRLIARAVGRSVSAVPETVS